MAGRIDAVATNKSNLDIKDSLDNHRESVQSSGNAGKINIDDISIKSNIYSPYQDNK